MFLAIKEMIKEKFRFLMVIIVTALIAYLVYFLSGLAFGLAKANTTAIDQWNSKGVILSVTANDNIYSSSIKEENYKTLVNDKNMALNVTNNVVVVNKDDDNKINLVFIGTADYKSELIPEIIKGRNIKNKDEIVLSDSFKKEANIKIGDQIKIVDNKQKFTVVGFTKTAEYNTTSVAYADLKMVSKEMSMYTPNPKNADAVSGPTPNMPNNISAIVVNEEVSTKKLDDNNLKLLSMNEFVDAIPGYQAQVLTFGLMIISLIVIASVIIGIFMYILTMQKKSIFGVLKIQGISSSYITKSVVFQTIIIVIIGLCIGMLFTIITFNLLPSSVPVKASWPLYGIISLLSIVCSLLGTVFSARSILKIDPLDSL